MSIPLLKACDIPRREDRSYPYVIHRLQDIVSEDLYIPKTPHRHSFYQILYIHKGHGIHTVDFCEIAIDEDMIFFLSPGQVHDLRFSDFIPEGILLNFRESFLNDFLAKKNFADSLPVFSKVKTLCYRHITSCKRDVEAAFDRMLVAEASEIPLKEEMIATLLLEILLMVSIRTREDHPEISIASFPPLIQRFGALVEKHFQEEHLPKFYAGQLAITSNYLNSLCRSVTGKTAGELIRNRIILEAKRLLVNSGLDVSQIAYELNFDDLSYFTKFFKANTGMTPLAFRKSLYL